MAAAVVLLKLPVKLGQEQKQGNSPEWSHNQLRNSIFIIWDDFARRETGRGSSLDLHMVLNHPGKPRNMGHPRSGCSPHGHGSAGKTRFHCDARIRPLKEGDRIALLPCTDLSKAPSLSRIRRAAERWQQQHSSLCVRMCWRAGGSNSATRQW